MVKSIIEALAGLSDSDPVLIALAALLILPLVFHWLSHTLRKETADEQMRLRKAVQYLRPLVAAAFVIAIILVLARAVYLILTR